MTLKPHIYLYLIENFYILSFGTRFAIVNDHFIKLLTFSGRSKINY